LNNYRHPLATETRHTLNRAQAERWLEAIVRSDVSRLDAALDSRFVYTQVFAASGNEHGILDVLTITRDGRLAIIELKATEHIHLPIQAADYWLRVRRQLELGEFRRYGYFQGVEIQQVPPLVYLVVLASFPSRHEHFAAPSQPANRSAACRPHRKLAPRHSRGFSPATRAYASSTASSTRLTATPTRSKFLWHRDRSRIPL
jgi:hypothetical protein